MDKLWAPWRIDYIRAPKYDGCVFCSKHESENDQKNLVLFKGSSSFVLMNLYPYSNGHLMLAPYQHTSDPSKLSKETNLEIIEMANQSMEILRMVMKAEGFNFGANVGKVAGAGIEEHVHYHIVPRWSGDTNFMPVLGKTKVIMEALEASWDMLKPHYNKIQNPSV
tara:strand:- start:50 stop:547 length:498 start_codon:yes stop_codon:yes gene_type:complete